MTFVGAEHRTVSRELLLGLTLGAYATWAVLYASFGGLMVTYWEAPFYPVTVAQPRALLILIPGLIVFGFGLLQVRLEKSIKSKAHERVTSAAVWLNTVGAIAFCLVGPLSEVAKQVPAPRIDQHPVWEFSVMFPVLAALACIPAGMVVSICNLVWSGFKIVKVQSSRVHAKSS
jgi:hypothetical protein